MMVVEYQKIELDYCVDCHGVWFDSGELELLVETMRALDDRLFTGDMLSTAEIKSKEKKRSCPICHQKMKKEVFREKPDVTVDVCPRDDGIWFDGDEMPQIISKVAEETAGRADASGLLAFVGTVFQKQPENC